MSSATHTAEIPGGHMRVTWYATSRTLQEFDGLFVRLDCDRPRGTVLLVWNGAQWVSGAASCSRYLCWGEPGDTEVSQDRARAVLEGLGGSMDAALRTFADIAIRFDREWTQRQRGAAGAPGGES